MGASSNDGAERVISFAETVVGTDGYALRHNPFNASKLGELFDAVPEATLKIDDDLLTLFCVLERIPIRKICRGPITEKVSGTESTLAFERGSMRKDLEAFVQKKYNQYFNLAPFEVGPLGGTVLHYFGPKPHDKTMGLYNETWRWLGEDP